MNGPVLTTPDEVVYPENDGKRMSDNTLQFQWIVTLQGGLDDLFRDNPDVFIAGDLLWYPVQGNNKIRAAPDAMVAFGRPKGYRGCYLQWKENGIAPQVVFEVLSPGNRPSEMARKLVFYEKYGVEEYYIYDPDHIRMSGYRRVPKEGNGVKHVFEQIPEMNGYTSPRLGIRFDLSGPELVVYRPDGNRFQTYLELSKVANEQSSRADQLEQQVEQLRAKMRAAGLDPDQV